MPRLRCVLAGCAALALAAGCADGAPTGLGGEEAQSAKRSGLRVTPAARAMRGLTIDYVRQRRAMKRGGEFHITNSGFDGVGREDGGEPEDLERLGEALDALGQVNKELAQLVDLHFFGGFSFAELARLRGVSERTIYRDWRKARLLLHGTLEP